MSTNNQYEWVNFYNAFAKKLLSFRSDRAKLVTIIKESYQEIEISLPTLEHSEDEFTDIDPFTTFGLFNKSSMTNDNRVKIITALGKRMGVSLPVPTTFNGVPTLNNQNATFYYFVGDGDRTEADIDNLWNLFEAALNYASDPSADNRLTISKYFDLVVNKKGNGNSKVSMALYWISPASFLNLDQRNEWYIYQSKKIPDDVVANLPKIKAKISASDYFDIIECLRSYLNSERTELKDFLDLSFEAWKYSNEVNEQKKKEKEQSSLENIVDSDVRAVHYWLYSPGNGAEKWDEFYKKGIMAIGWDEIGDLMLFDSKDAMKAKMKELYDSSMSYKNAVHATWQFSREIQPGDIVFVKKGMHQLVGRGVVESNYEFDDAQKSFKHIHKMKWTHNGNWEHPGVAAMKTLTDITSYTDYVEKLNKLFDVETEDEEEELEIEYPAYGVDEFLDDVYMSRDEYNTLVSLVLNKKNVILQGAPGVGKTFAAKRLAYSIMGEKNTDRVMVVQFHQSYSYEDFIEGIRPTDSAEAPFKIRKGSFYNFCVEKAKDDVEHEYFFIIDEINRGNLSKIFGELFMLIENDKRGPKNEIQLLYSGDKFYVPENVHIIGLMNTADRSLAMLDYALRRRFAFYEMKPGFESEGFRKYVDELDSEKFRKLIDCVERLNTRIAEDESPGEGFCIGHSYFCNLKEVTDQALSGIVEFELIPLLKEYWFDEPSKIREWAANLRNSIL